MNSVCNNIISKMKRNILFDYIHDMHLMSDFVFGEFYGNGKFSLPVAISFGINSSIRITTSL